MFGECMTDYSGGAGPNEFLQTEYTATYDEATNNTRKI